MLIRRRMVMFAMAVVLAIAEVPVSEAAGPIQIGGSEYNATLSGYLRQYLSMNLQNPPETKANDRFNLSMVRTQLQAALDGNLGIVTYHTRGRLTREVTTSYLDRLQTPADLVGGGAGTGGANGGQDLVSKRYDQNQLREAWFDVPIGQWTHLRVGKQQVVFGHTDFFQALDMLEGYNYTWRSFLVPENEDIRKPLNMVNLMFNTPSGGQLQIVAIPGSANAYRDIGNTYDLFGGRWANQPNKGIDFYQIMNNNYDNPKAKGDATTGAIRWSGIAGDINYSVAYLHVWNPDPVVNSPFNPYGQAPTGLLGDFIHPIINVVGGSISGYSSWADAVFSSEVAYTFNKPFNVGENPATCGAPFPGFCGIVTKKTVRYMVRMDKTVNWTHSVFGAQRGSLMSFQLFDTWLPNFKGSDHIVDLAGFAAPKHRHNMILTAILGLSYMNSTINPQLAGGYDITNGGGFVIPSIQYVKGDHWRFKLEADLFFPSGSNTLGGNSSDTHIFGYFKNNDQLMARMTYQF